MHTLTLLRHSLHLNMGSTCMSVFDLGASTLLWGLYEFADNGAVGAA